MLEYYNKRNFVESVHAKENHVLSKHGPFCSTPIHKNMTVGSKEHAENMKSSSGHEKMYYSGFIWRQTTALLERNPKPQNLSLMINSLQMQDFLSLNEEGKHHFPRPTYSPSRGEIFDFLNNLEM